MKNLNIIFYMILVFVVGFSIGTGFIITYEQSTFKGFWWKEDPIVANCYGSELLLGRARSSLRFWDNLGYKHKKYVHKPTIEICDGPKILEGYIIFRKAGDDQLKANILAFTTRRHASTQMVGSTIYFRNDTQNMDLLIEHELGHAFGFIHTDIPEHIMHPMYDQMGIKFWIPD